jgi:hypothetical protein
MLKKSIVAPRNIPKTLTPWSSSLYWFRPTSQEDRAGHFLLHIWYPWSCRYARYLRGFLPHLRYAQLPSFSHSPSLGFSFIMPVSPSHGLPPSHLITRQSSKSSTVISYTSGHQWVQHRENMQPRARNRCPEVSKDRFPATAVLYSLPLYHGYPL